MNRIWLIMLVALAGPALPSRAAFQFISSPSGVSGALNGAAYDGQAAFLAVGTNSSLAIGTLAGDHIQWASNGVPGNASLQAATYGGGMFLAGGLGALVFVSTDGSHWVQTSNAFPDPAAVKGLAFNPLSSPGGRFAAVSDFVEMSWATPTLNWSNASIPSASFLESFRGVTAFGANRFAACGILGDIRISSDGGQTWTNPPGKALSVNALNLSGIASDGANKLVAVGAAGVITTSTDGGVTWVTMTNSTKTNLNGVAYAGTGFIAGGDGGVILTSPDGLAWSTNASPTSRTLRAVVFANSGTLSGVGALVGDNGTIVLAGSAPLPPVSRGNQTNCSDNLPNPPLGADVVTNTANPLVTIDWYNAPTNGTRVLADSATFTPPESTAPPNTLIDYVYFAEARDRRTGFVSTNRTPVKLTLFPRPTAVVTGTTAICNGQSTVVGAALTGVAPWTVVWTANGVSVVTNADVLVPTNSLVVAPANPALSAPTNVVYTVSALSDFYNCGAFSTNLTGDAVITINPRPTASLTISAQPAICNGGTTTLRAALTGLGPWTLTLASNAVPVLTTNLAGATTDLLVKPVNPAPNSFADVVYTVASLVDNGATTACPAEAQDITNNAVVRINPRPTASLTVSGPVAICNGGTTTLRATLTGLGPWTLTLASNAIPVLTTNLAGAITDLLVKPADSAPNNFADVVYTVASLVDHGATTACPAEPQDLINNAVVRINPRPTASLTVNGQAAICNGGTTTLRATLTGLGPWTLTLASNAIPVLTTNLASATTDLLVKPVNPAPNNFTDVVYTVSALVDNGATTICPAEPQDITNTAVVRINPRPTASLTISGQPAICNGGTTTLRAALTGLGPWTLTLASNTIPVLTTNLASAITDLLVKPVNPAPNNFTDVVYTVASLVDNGATTACPAETQDLTNTAVVRINPRPTASQPTFTVTNCNSDIALAYTLTNTLTGLGPWTVWWNDGLVQTAAAAAAGPVTLTRTVIATNATLNLASNNTFFVTVVSNADTCLGNPPGDITGTANIWVNPRPTATLSIGVTDIVSQDANGTNLIVSVQTAGTNLLVQTRFAYVSNSVTGHGSKETTNSTTVTLSSLTLYVTNHVAFTGIGPWANTWRQTGASPSGSLLQTNDYPTNASTATASYVWSVVISSTTPGTNFTYTIAALADRFCAAEPADLNRLHVIVNGRLSANVNNVGPNTLCNGTGAQAEIRADLGGTAPWALLWNDGTTNIVSATPFVRMVSPTDPFPNAAITNYYWITNLSDLNTSTSDTNLDLLGVASVVVDPVPANPPNSLGDQLTCYGSPATLAVSVPSGFTADWYSDPGGTNLLLSGSTTLLTNILNTSSVVTQTFWAAARFDDPLLTNTCRSAALTNVSLISTNCPKDITISYSGTNGVGTNVWYGNWILQSTTNLALVPPAWTDVVTNNTFGAHAYVWSNPPPIRFFRLYAPTN